jgi:hypothetical protein
MSPLLSPLSSHALVFGIVWLVALWLPRFGSGT